MSLADMTAPEIVPLLERSIRGLVVEHRQTKGGQRRVFVGSVGNKKYALKVFEGSGDSLVRAQREIATLRRCKSTHLVRPGPYDLIPLTESTESNGDEPGVALWLYAEEFVEGESLRTVLRRGPVGAADAFRLALECLDAIETLWALRRVHRDLKPENIMIRSSNGAYTVVDAGYVLVLDATRVTSPLLAVGTPGYMAPEQFSGRRPLVDFRADLFSLGVCLYESMTGQHPFRRPGDTTDDVLQRTVEDHPPAVAAHRPDIPACLSDIVLRMLKKRAHLRYGSTSQLRDHLARCRDKGGLGA